MSAAPDQADRLKDGTLSSDPRAETRIVAPPKPRVVTVQEMLEGSVVSALRRDTNDRGPCTTGHYKLDRITGGLRPAFSWLVGADTSWGKCLGRGTGVKFADGSTVLAEDVRAGDRLMGPDSKPRTVLSLSRGRGRMYRIVPMRGEEWLCNWAHVLVVVSTRTGAVTEISVDEFLARSPTWRHQQKLFHASVNYPRIPVPEVDPWFVGLWYGDGTKDLHTVAVTTADAEVVQGIRRVAAEFGLHVNEYRKNGNLAAAYALCESRGKWRNGGNRLLRAMRKMVGDVAVSLPDCMRYGSRSVRLRFLAGLIDADGFKKDAHHCEIVTRYAAWAPQIVELCRSLGLQAVVYEKRNVPGYEQNVYQRIQISGNLSVVPTRIARKRFPNTEPRTDCTRVGFKIEPCGNQEFFGWQLDGDGRFLLGDLTVTHNSSFVIMITDENLRANRRVLIVSSEDDESVYGDRLMVRRARVNAMRYRDRKLTPEEMSEVTAVAARAEAVPVFIDAKGWKIEDLEPHIRAVIREERIDVVVFDYIQEFDSKRRFQDERLKYKAMARIMRNLGKQAKITAVIISQLTLPDDTKQPTRHNIRECKDIAHGSEVILIGYEPGSDIKIPERQATEKTPYRAAVEIAAGTKIIYVDKVKNGPRRIRLAMQWNEACACFETQRYTDLSRDEQDDPLYAK